MRNKYLKQPDNRPPVPFESTEEAWFWYCLCEQLGFQRGKNQGNTIARPCETSDIILAVKRLFQKGSMRLDHIRVLQKYGFEQAPPHINFGATEHICRLWREAIGLLDSLLKQKGIVACLILCEIFR